MAATVRQWWWFWGAQRGWGGGRWTNVLRGRMREVSLLPSSLRLDFLRSACGGLSFCSSDSDWRSAPLSLFGFGSLLVGFTTDTLHQSHEHREPQGVSCMYAASHKFPPLDIHRTITRPAPTCSAPNNVQLQQNQQQQSNRSHADI